MSFIIQKALARNSSFGFLALDFVSAKTKCAVCAAGFSMKHNGLGYGFVAEKSAGIFQMSNEYTKKQ